MSSALQKLEEFLRLNPSVDFIRFQWVDYSGVLRARFVPTSRCLRIANGRSAMCLAQNSMIIPISTAPVIFSLSDYHETWNLLPDWSSLRICGTNANHATAMCFVDQKDAELEFDKCPRTMLVLALRRLEREWGAKVLIGFEIEIVLLDDSNNVIKPMDRLNGYSRIAGLRAETLDLVEEIVSALKKASIGVHHFHAEVRDQLEIALAAEPALEAVDSLVLAQEIIRTICVRRNLKATMAPKPTFAGPSNGLHLHLSLAKVGRASADHFLAGVLSHMGSLCAFGMANYDSYARAVSDAAGAWIGFGTDNRDLPVRKIDDAHWEFRMMDSTANPYIFTAAVLRAAMDGLANRTELTWRDCKFFPHLLDEKRRAQFGLDKRMPATLKEALECLKKDTAIETWIGEEEDLLKWYISVKDREVEEFGKMANEQRRLRFLGYF
ncbi:Glutamine synthetase [Cordyceps fumosorosea ARSEF 2679]|uniref:Glutamine synthetase n=1 Tax=Cordyceps fumosorosea (strain ARSEF 2679) TaxID=1081104 RepID=A0A167RNR3_CORFA|nr:Glutamine synthetase [Cordyceps fumosorosea ARSEF 2679]OAA58775.1 Glutamine synthetase [Cordyceps fumosorosea ARSEF 2679]